MNVIVNRPVIYLMWNKVCDKASEIYNFDPRKEGWKLDFNNRKSSYGLCHYGKKTVFISEFLTKTQTYDEVMNTVIHEVAHVLAPGQKHNRVWRSIFIAMGGNGQTRTTANAATKESVIETARWIVVNTLDNTVVAHYHRKPKDNFSQRWLRGRPETKGKLVLKRA
jgi:hypothetical protein